MMYVDDVNKLSYLQAEEVMNLLETRRSGLTKEAAAERLRRYGRNQLPKAASLSLGKLFLQQFTHFMALLLWLAGILAFMVDMPELGWATWAVIVLNAVFSFWQEYRADKALSALSAMLPRRVKVYRDGKLLQILADELVLGDVLLVEAGDHVPADARLLEAEDLFVDVSLLTGESLPVECSALAKSDDAGEGALGNRLFAGTMISAGRGIAVVYAVGRQTELGKVTKLTAGIVRQKSALELQVQKVVRLITVLALSMGLLVFVLAVWLLDIDLRSSFIFCIGIIVANVPEGLLPTVSLSLAVGVQRMAQQNALVRKLSAVESLCATSVICTDKTGTLTMNEVTVKKVWLPEGSALFSGNGYEKEGAVTMQGQSEREQLELLLTIGSICSDAQIEEDENQSSHWAIKGDPTEVALLVAAAKNGQMPTLLQQQFGQRKTKQFNSQRKMMSTQGTNLSHACFPQGKTILMVKGAPLETLKCCSYMRMRDGVQELDEEARQKIGKMNDSLAREGQRVLALAYREGASGETLGEEKLVFVGLAGMMDPPRPDVSEAIGACREAGIIVTMITGDYGLTAEAIGRQIGLVKDSAVLVTGAELAAMDAASLQALLQNEKPVIFSRTNPEHKLKIVETYQALGHVVAVTGDGVNDAPALRAADIGIAMGRGGTDVAREVADIVLLDDHFATIVKAIEQGRAIYDNIRKFMKYILASNIPELVPFLAMIFLKIPPALNILQILAIDIGTDMVPALALGAEAPEKGVLQKRPSDYAENLLNQKLVIHAYCYLGLIEAVLSMTAFFLVWYQQGYALGDMQQAMAALLANTAAPELAAVYQQATTLAMLAIIACQMGNVLVCRSENMSVWELPLRSNLLILFGLGTEALLAMALVYIPAVAAVFLTQPLPGENLLLLLICPMVLILLEEVRRYCMR